MKGILIEPGKAPVVAALPDTLQGIENYLHRPCDMRVMPRTPAVLIYGHYDGIAFPASLFNRTYRGRQLLGPILVYGWRNNNIQSMSKTLQADMLERIMDYEVRA